MMKRPARRKMKRRKGERARVEEFGSLRQVLAAMAGISHRPVKRPRSPRPLKPHPHFRAALVARQKKGRPNAGI